MNRLTLAVAGGRKTQSIVEHCTRAQAGRRILALTYTQVNQGELTNRLARVRPLQAHVELQGWFSFLLAGWVRPYLPLKFPGRRLRGLNFEGDPGTFATGARRFLDVDGRAFRRHLAQLAIEIDTASSGAVLDRLSRIYDEIHIDEVQDLNGYDLEVLSRLLDSPIDLHMVGDIRQALIFTNVKDQKNCQFKGIKIGKWFERQESAGKLEIVRQSTTWRSNQAIASFADSVFGQSWGFPLTISENSAVTGHDGVFGVATEHVYKYMEAYQPLCLRHSVNCAKNLSLPFRNIGIAKGMGVDRVLIAPTKNVLEFLRRGTMLTDMPSCSLYVAVTRARSSVAFVCDNPFQLGLPVWVP